MKETTVCTGFEWRDGPSGRVLVSTLLERLAPHLFSTRDATPGGAAPGYASVAAAFGEPTDTVVWVRQVHGAGVLVVRPGQAIENPPPEADAVVSIDPARVVLVRIADCVPVLLADRRHRTVAAVHAGWRGSAAGVLGAAVGALNGLGITAADLVAAVGPSIGPCCYQVDAVVRDTFLASRLNAARWFTLEDAGHWRLDLWTAARDQLIEAGVPAEAVAVAGSCTAHNPDWWSHRRDGPAAGRMVAAIRLPAGRRGVC